MKLVEPATRTQVTSCGTPQFYYDNQETQTDETVDEIVEEIRQLRAAMSIYHSLVERLVVRLKQQERGRAGAGTRS